MNSKRYRINESSITGLIGKVFSIDKVRKHIDIKMNNTSYQRKEYSTLSQGEKTISVSNSQYTLQGKLID
jgi:hypothetical protein